MKLILINVVKKLKNLKFFENNNNLLNDFESLYDLNY